MPWCNRAADVTKQVIRGPGERVKVCPDIREQRREILILLLPRKRSLEAFTLCLHFLVGHLRPREVHTRRQVQRQIGTAHEANRAHVGDGGAGSPVGLRQR